MDRNFFRRIETSFPILDSELKARLIADLDALLSDNTQAWELQPDGRYRRLAPEGSAEPFSVQKRLLETMAEAS
jgi:polyphosphate kinase